MIRVFYFQCKAFKSVVFKSAVFVSQEAVSSSSEEELCFVREPRSSAGSSIDLTATSPQQRMFDFSSSARTSPEESYLSSASSSSSSVVELDAPVVDSPVAIPSSANSPSPEADKTRRLAGLTMSAASSASLLPASLQSDFLFSLTDMERRQLCGGHEEDLAGEESYLWYSNH